MGSKINLLVFSPYYPPHVGGLENHAEEFAIAATKRGYRVIVWTANIPHRDVFDEIKNGVRIIRYDALELFGGFPIPIVWQKSFWNQYKSIQKERPYIVISRTRFFLSSLLARIFAVKNNAKHIHIEHGSDYVHLHNKITSACAYLYDILIGTYVLKHADAVVANSQATKKFVQELTKGFTTPTLIYRGVNKDHIFSQVPHNEERNGAQGKVILCYAGRLIDGKGVQHLIDALQGETISEKIVCWIIGSGPQRKALESLVKKNNLYGKVIFFGDKSRTEVIALMKASDIVINPSYTEGIPTSIIEAALCKKAIIATHVGGTPEIIEHEKSGILIPSHDTDALRRSLEHLVDNNMLREQYGNAAYERCSTMFSWDTAMDSYELLFKEIGTV